jgi:Ca2+-binding RTX toxin-like protein
MSTTDLNSNLGFNGWFEDQRYSVRIEVDNPGNTLKLGFGSTIDQAITDESWGIDNLVITSQDATSSVTDGNDTINGGAGDDVIYSGHGADTMDGGEGSDTIYVETWVGSASSGVNTVNDTGTSGTDTLVLTDSGTGDLTLDIQSDFSLATSGIEVIDGTGLAGEIFTSRGNAVTYDFTGITLNGVDEIRGSESDDSIIGSAGADTIGSLGGDDTIFASDVAFGGTGNDTFQLSGGTNTYFGGAGDDTFEVGINVDNIFGGVGTDTLSNVAANDQITVTFTGNGSGTFLETDGDSGTFESIERVETGNQNDTFLIGEDDFINLVADGIDGNGARTGSK